LEAKEKRKESKEQAISWAAKRLKLLTKDPTKTDENGRWKCGAIKDLANEACKKFNVDGSDAKTDKDPCWKLLTTNQYLRL
jgi:hypothetical protein